VTGEEINTQMSCPGARPGKLPGRNVQVSHLPCLNAKKAIERGEFELTRGGEIFSTHGFRCESPVGPLPKGPRFTVCRNQPHRFRFYGPSEESRFAALPRTVRTEAAWWSASRRTVATR
jgi:hypothetical protein